MIRALALACFALVAACGDDTTTVPADMNTCMSSCCEGTACADVGSRCTVFESVCTCGANHLYTCTGIVLHDLAIPRFGD